MLTNVLPSGDRCRPKILEAPKHPIFQCNFCEFCDLITNISGTQQDVVNRKMALETMITLAHVCLIWWTLVHKWRKIWPEFWLTQDQLFRMLISRMINGNSSWKFYN